MFKTIVIACALADMTNCITFIDTRGPYQTFAQCQARAYEMGNAIMEIQGEHIRPVTFDCKQLHGRQL
jgi:hypothetical protein